MSTSPVDRSTGLDIAHGMLLVGMLAAHVISAQGTATQVDVLHGWFGSCSSAPPSSGCPVTPWGYTCPARGGGGSCAGSTAVCSSSWSCSHVAAAEPLTTGASAFFAAGAGGAFDIGVVARRGVDDLALTLQLAPVDAGYMYAEGHDFSVTYGNRGYSLAADFGLDIVRMASIEAPIALLVRGDSYFTGYEVQRTEYFSPERFDGHVAGGQVRWRPASSATLSAHAGRTFSVGSEAAVGWAFGGGLEWNIGDWKIDARAEYRDDLYYRVRRGWLAVTGQMWLLPRVPVAAAAGNRAMARSGHADSCRF